MKALHLVTSLLLPLAAHARIGGRCSSFWSQTSCICLDKNVCTGQYGGVTIEGVAPDWPCPNDPANVLGCQISPCPGVGGGTKCTWSDLCGIPSGGE